MTREEAIELIAAEFDTDRCVGEGECLDVYRHCRDALRALGVQDAEMPRHLLKLPPDEKIDRLLLKSQETTRLRSQ